jgi:hypothetical protein
LPRLGSKLLLAASARTLLLTSKCGALWMAMARMWTKLAEEDDQMPHDTEIADDALR